METLGIVETWTIPVLSDQEEEFREQFDNAVEAEWELSKTASAMKNFMKDGKAIGELNDGVTHVQHCLREVREFHITTL